MIDFGILVHGGVGSSQNLSGACKQAAEKGFRLLQSGGSAIDATVEALRFLEDDGRFNAGTGSILRLDGVTREMDAAVMDSLEHVGMVICVRETKNPILLARALLDTPHVALSGEGATRFAAIKSFEPLGKPPEHVLERYKYLREIISSRELASQSGAWKENSLASLWNFPNPPDPALLLHDTIGAVALDRQGVFAAATSTGGTSAMLLGRVGDSPLPGCGLYAGNEGAVTATGTGEEIIRKLLCRRVYESMTAGATPEEACTRGIALFSEAVPVGLVAISRQCFAIRTNREMAAWATVKERG